MNEEKCPCCPNHCSKDNLGCERGRNYFNNQNNSFEPNNLNEQIVMDLRKCGHLLHHNRELNIETILSNFSDDELNELHKLLSKFYHNAE